MSFYVYILRCSDSSYYVGHTDNLEARLMAHERGEIPGHTYSRRPVELVFADGFPSREAAFERERQIKGWRRAKKEALIRRDWDLLRRLASARAPLILSGNKPLILSLSKDERDGSTSSP